MDVAVTRLMGRHSPLLTFVELATRMDVPYDAVLVHQKRHGREFAVLGEPPSFQSAPISINGKEVVPPSSAEVGNFG